MAERVRLAGGARRKAAHHQARRGLIEQRREKVLRYVQTHAPTGTMDVARGLTLPAAVTRSDLDSLERRSLVERTGSEFGVGWIWMPL